MTMTVPKGGAGVSKNSNTSEKRVRTRENAQTNYPLNADGREKTLSVLGAHGRNPGDFNKEKNQGYFCLVGWIMQPRETDGKGKKSGA